MYAGLPPKENLLQRKPYHTDSTHHPYAAEGGGYANIGRGRQTHARKETHAQAQTHQNDIHQARTNTQLFNNAVPVIYNNSQSVDSVIDDEDGEDEEEDDDDDDDDDDDKTLNSNNFSNNNNNSMKTENNKNNSERYAFVNEAFSPQQKHSSSKENPEGRSRQSDF